MKHALRVIRERVTRRGEWGPVPDDQAHPVTLYIDTSGQEVAITFPLQSGEFVTVLYDGTITETQDASPEDLEAGLAAAREAMRRENLEPWF